MREADRSADRIVLTWVCLCCIVCTLPLCNLGQNTGRLASPEEKKLPLAHLSMWISLRHPVYLCYKITVRYNNQPTEHQTVTLSLYRNWTYTTAHVHRPASMGGWFLLPSSLTPRCLILFPDVKKHLFTTDRERQR